MKIRTGPPSLRAAWLSRRGLRVAGPRACLASLRDDSAKLEERVDTAGYLANNQADP